MATVNLNHNAAACIHHVNYWGKTIYHNICSQTTYEVPWGFFDYMLTVIGLTLMAAFTLGVVIGVCAFLVFAINEKE